MPPGTLDSKVKDRGATFTNVSVSCHEFCSSDRLTYFGVRHSTVQDIGPSTFIAAGLVKAFGKLSCFG